MSDEKGLLAAIWEYPHDDNLRLVYADWLEEHGQLPRAEFIRLQCERERLDEWDDADRIEQIEQREAELWAVHRKTWRATLPKRLQTGVFRRGFVYPRQLSFGGAKFLKLPPGAFDAAPQWSVVIEHLVGHFDKVFTSPLFVRFNELTLDLGRLREDPFAKLANNTSLRNVSDLWVADRITKKLDKPESVAAFFNGPATAALTKLRSKTDRNDVAFAALATSRTAQQLSHLDLVGWRISASAGPPFSADRFPRLRSLRVLDRCIVQFLTTTPTTQIQKLNLSGCHLDDTDIGQLAGWPGLQNVRMLDLGYQLCNQTGYLELARSPNVDNLKYLKLDGWQLSQMSQVKNELIARFGAALHSR